MRWLASTVSWVAKVTTMLALGSACGSASEETDRVAHEGGVGGAGASGGLGGLAGQSGGNSGGSAAAEDASTSEEGAAGAADSNGGGDAPAGEGGAEDASVEAGDQDAATVPTSQLCGDGVRDPVLEECDDGTGLTPPDSCSADCRVQDVLVAPGPASDGGLPPKQIRHLGLGRHPVAAGASGFAVAFVDTSSGAASVMLRVFGPAGAPGPLVAVTSGAGVLTSADPVVAALPGGKYAVSYTDLNQDGDKQGVALRVIDPAGPTLGPVVRVNSPVLGNQRDPEVIWTGSEIVVAYLDEGQLGSTASDIRLRRLSEGGAPKASPQVLAATNDFEGKAALLPFGGDFAAAWVALGQTQHKVVARAGSSTWSISMPPPSDAESQPMLAQIDATHLLLVYVEGGGASVTPRLYGALIDTTLTAAPTPFPIAPLLEPYASNPALAQTQPAATRVGSRLFVAWRSEALPGSVELTDLWLKEIKWSATATSLALDLSSPEVPLPRAIAHSAGNQAYPALAPTPLLPGGAIASAWEDHGRVFGSIEGTPDVVAELIPVPMVRLPSEGGLE